MNHFFIMILMLLILLIMGCSNATDSEFPPSYDGLIIINGTEYEMERGGYSWKRKKGFRTEVVQTDHASPYQMANYLESIKTNPNQKADIQIEGNPNIRVYLWNENRDVEIKQNANQIILPSSQGKYIYEVVSQWTNGTVSYIFVVEII